MNYLELPNSLADLFSEHVFEQYSTGAPSLECESRIQSLTTDVLFPFEIANRDMAQGCLSGIWLLHHFLDHSHKLSQSLPTAEGSFWHAIMHRLEGDFWNSKYWYQKVGNHPVIETMLTETGWTPSEFVDECESSDASATRIQSVAIMEWKALFEYCYRHARD